MNRMINEPIDGGMNLNGIEV
ncbi:hypothetical protein [Plasmodium yoelii yoelii]|uniref:Uncharacterized protein n=1 Tax=Plasmodium yoelii yoelii TaxID=73239 RepID=Q7R8K9_PLAYO|nr:hypothetical protein [Plasmodium yoelii yoelii]